MNDKEKSYTDETKSLIGMGSTTKLDKFEIEEQNIEDDEIISSYVERD